MASSGSRVDVFSAWLTGMGDAWERGDAAGLTGLFTVGATFAPDPFADVVRGRRAIVAWLEGAVAGWHGSAFAAQVLGAGDTYGVAHWRVASAERAIDGVWVVALDGHGRCESLREWSSASAPVNSQIRD
jgi:hypothetical protein